MKKQIILSMLVCLLLVNIVTALDFDNVKSDITLTKGQAIMIGDKELAYNSLWETYRPIEIKNFFGLGATLFSGAIIEHTETCSSDCESIITIDLKEKGVPIEDIRFKKLVGEDWIDFDFSRYNIYYSNSEESYKQDIYETQCVESIALNGTKTNLCSQVKTGIEELSRPIWNELQIKEISKDIYEEQCSNVIIDETTYNQCYQFKIGVEVTPAQELETGTYKIKVNANKKSSQVIDWQIKTQGQWIEDWATWGAINPLWNNLISYYKLDNNNFSDSYGIYHLTNSLTVNGSGIINSGRMFTPSTSPTNYLENRSIPNFNNVSNYTISLWVKINGTGGDRTIMTFGNTTGNHSISLYKQGSNNYTCFQISDMGLGGAFVNCTSGKLSDSYWTHIVITGNSSKYIKMYINGSNTVNGTDPTLKGAKGGGVVFGTSYTGSGVSNVIGNNFNGTIDEIGIWNRTLTNVEVLQLYNSGLGFNYAISGITLNSPTDNTFSNNAIQTFSCSAIPSFPATLMNVSLWNNRSGIWSLDTTHPLECSQESATVPNQAGTDGNCELDYSGEYYPYLLSNPGNAYDGDWDTYAHLNYQGALNINYKIPTNINNATWQIKTGSTGIFNRTIPIGCLSGNYLNLSIANYGDFYSKIYCYNQISSSWYWYSTTTAGLDLYEERIIWTYQNYPSIFTRTLPQNSTKWNCQACDSDGDCAFASSNYTINIDSIAPTITITNGNGTNNYGILNQNHTINFTATDLHSVDKCWYFNGTVNLTSNCLIANKTITRLNDNITIYANDTYGNIASQFVEWDFKVIENNETYLNQTIEGATNNFLLNTSLKSGITINEVNLIYNGTSYSGNAFLIGNNTIISKNIVIPGVVTTTNYSFYWSIRLSDLTLINTSSNNQTVYNLSIDNCSVYSYELYKFNLLDEELQTSLTGITTMDIAINIYSVDRINNILNFSEGFNSTNPVRICLGSSLINQSNYSVDVIIRYEKNDSHSIEYYNIVNDILSNSSILQTINLYDLLLADTTEFRLTFIDSDFIPREDALVYLMRQYISENTFKTVELPKTDSNGQTVLHMVRNDVIYNIIVIDSVSKEVLGSFNNIVAFCEDISIGKCEINLNAFSTEEEVYNYDEALGIIISNPNYDNVTRIISFDFTTTSGTPRTVNMQVTRNDIFGNDTICDTTLISAGGTISCSIPSTIEDTNLITSIYVDGVLVANAQVQMDKTNLGYIGYIALFFMMISLVFMFSSSKEGVLIGLGLGVLSGIGLGLITGTVLGVGSVGIWIIILILLAFWKLNQGRQS